MMKKLRTVLAAMFLVSALFSNANAFTTENDGVKLGRPTAGVCWFNFNGMWIPFAC